jgi:anthranilate synthase/indole-3-glycerol phosphate synthase/phosphoribosylanthranilate isomerase
MKGGTWAENERLSKQATASGHGEKTNGTTGLGNGALNSDASDKDSIHRIYRHRRAAVAAQKKVPSQRPSDLQATYDLNLSPPQISFQIV